MAVTTYRVLQGVSIGSIGFLIGAILYLVFFSTIVGIVFGFITAYLVRKLFTIPRQQTPSYEVALMVVMAFMSYYVSTLFGLSGILTIFVCGVIDSHYTWYVYSAFLVVCLLVLSVPAVGERRYAPRREACRSEATPSRRWCEAALAATQRLPDGRAGLSSARTACAPSFVSPSSRGVFAFALFAGIT